jgi:hypothetical protein
MKLSIVRLGAWFGLSFGIAAAAACGGNGSGTTSSGTGGHGGSGGHTATGTAGDGGGFITSSGTGTMAGFDVQPSAMQTITVTAGQPVPAVTYTATLDGQPANAGWGVDKGNVGTIPAGPASTATFTPTGKAGGLVNVIAGLNKMTQTRAVMVKLTATQNGADPTNPAEAAQIPADVPSLKTGGGIGGVGGEGLGPAVSDAGTLTALASPSANGSAQGLTLLYPYDNTVWPRGMLAPLLMWGWSFGDADAIQIELATTSGSFTYKGTFARPAILTQTGGKFVRHPIPQDVWEMATNSAGGADKLLVKLTVAKGGMAYGPIARTWTIAPARLTGTVYYNSYGTQLVKNWVALDKAGHSVGAAILGVRSGDLGPKLVVGKNSPTNALGNPADDSGCRVCHVVSSRGRWLLTQSEQGTPGDGRSFLYDLNAADVQGSVAQIPQEGVFGWAALNADATYALTNTINPSSTNPAITNSSAGTATSSFWQFGASPQQAALTGLPAGASAGYPTYSPDDKFVAYIDAAGKTQDVHGPIVVASYDAASQVFSNATTIASPAAGQRLGYPVFVPDDSALVFETQVRSSQSDSVVVTRNGARSELWWVNLTGGNPTPVPLAALNGKSGTTPYIPLGPNNHGAGTAGDPQSSYNEAGLDDTTLNYEPTVLPIVAGGYAWVVFTSRRLYGNQLTATPWQSWPPSYDTTSLDQATVKKLWVAAIDLNAPPGTDPSHPAFYLPAQEILAGNSRGFWVLDPCRADGATCDTGDQCCNGYCEPNGTDGTLVCSNTPPGGNCSAPQEKCTTAADCCDPTNVCINGFCAQKGVN